MRTYKISVTMTIFLLLLGCGKKENVTLKGNIVGFAGLVDENGVQIRDKEGVTVKIENTSNTVNTDQNGRFEFSNISAGTYNLTYSKEGFGIYKRLSYQFVGGNEPGVLDKITLYQVPSVEIQNVNVSYADSVLDITGTLSEIGQCNIVYYLNDSADVSNEHYDYSYKSKYCCLPTHDISDYINLPLDPLYYAHSVYMIIYLANYYDNNGYFDYVNQKYILSSAKKASDVIKIQVN